MQPPGHQPSLPLPVLLGVCPLFAAVEPAGREVLARFFHRLPLRPGALLIQQGDPAELLYLIGSGSVEVVAEEGGQPVVLAKLGAGEILGEVALNHPTTRNASVRVAAAGEAWAVPAAAFRGLALAGDPVATAVLAGLGRILCQRLRAVDQRIADLTEVAPLPPSESPRIQAIGTTAAAPDPAHLPQMRTLPVFAALEERQPGALARLLPYLRQWELPAGAVLFSEGTPGDSAFVVLRGAVEVSVARGLTQQRLALLGPGRLFGEVSLIDGAPRSATCTALRHTVLLELDPARYAALRAEEVAIAAQLITTMNRNLSASLASARRTLLGTVATAADEPALQGAPLATTDAPETATLAFAELRRSMADHLRRVPGPLGPRTRIDAGSGTGPALGRVDGRTAELRAWPRERLRPALERSVRSRLGALAEDQLTVVPAEAPLKGLFDLLDLSLPAVLRPHLQLAPALAAGPAQPAVFTVAGLPPSWDAAIQDTVAVNVPVPALHDGRPDPAALTAALLAHADRALRLVLLPQAHPGTGVALDVEGLSQLAHDCGALVFWVVDSATAPPPLRSPSIAPGREMGHRDGILIRLRTWPGMGASPSLAVLGGHLPRRPDAAPVPVDTLARVWSWLETVDQLGPTHVAQRQEAHVAALVEALRAHRDLRLVGTPAAPRLDRVAVRVRGPEGSLAPALAQAIARDHHGVELGITPDGSANLVWVPWWLDEAERDHVAWSLDQLAARGRALSAAYQCTAGAWQHVDALPGRRLPEEAPETGSLSDWEQLRAAGVQSRTA